MPWHESHTCHQQMLNLMTFSVSFSFVHCLIFFGSWGTAWCPEHEASSLFSKHATAYRVNTFFPRIFFWEKEKRRTKKIKATPASPCATPLCETERESNWCCHKRAHCSCSFNTAQKISPWNEKCHLLPLWDCTVSVYWRKCRRLSINFPKCLLASPSLPCLSPLQSFFGLLLPERFKTCRTVALEVFSGHSFNKSVISLA